MDERIKSLYIKILKKGYEPTKYTETWCAKYVEIQPPLSTDMLARIHGPEYRTRILHTIWDNITDD